MPELIIYNGHQVEAERVEVVSAQEPWGEYLLADGTVLRNKAVLVAIWRLCGHHGADGHAVYVYQAQNVSATVQALPDFSSQARQSVKGWCVQCYRLVCDCVCDREGMTKGGTG